MCHVSKSHVEQLVQTWVMIFPWKHFEREGSGSLTDVSSTYSLVADTAAAVHWLLPYRVWSCWAGRIDRSSFRKKQKLLLYVG